MAMDDCCGLCGLCGLAFAVHDRAIVLMDGNEELFWSHEQCADPSKPLLTSNAD